MTSSSSASSQTVRPFAKTVFFLRETKLSVEVLQNFDEAIRHKHATFVGLS